MQYKQQIGRIHMIVLSMPDKGTPSAQPDRVALSARLTQLHNRCQRGAR
jgi:hypothetical protein